MKSLKTSIEKTTRILAGISEQEKGRQVWFRSREEQGWFERWVKGHGVIWGGCCSWKDKLWIKGLYADLRCFRRPDPSLGMSEWQRSWEGVRYAWEFWYFCPNQYISHEDRQWFENLTAEEVNEYMEMFVSASGRDRISSQGSVTDRAAAQYPETPAQK